jgi:GNAT superfamily N-acetyltransferase
VGHVALVAVAQEDGRNVIVVGGRYVVARPDTAELAFAVIDDYEGRGIGAALMRHLTLLARAGGIKELIAEVLPENIPMLKVFQKSGLGLQTKHRAGVVIVALNITNDITKDF